MLANFTKMIDDSGGLAKVTCDFADEMQKRGHEVIIVYSDGKDGNFCFTLNTSIDTYDLRNFQGRKISYPWYFKIIREFCRTFSPQLVKNINNKFIEKYLLKNLSNIFNKFNPDIIIAFQSAATKLLVCDLKVKTPVITMFHGDLRDYFYNYPKTEILSLKKCALCQFLLPSFEEFVKKNLPEIRSITIGNAVPQFSQAADLLKEKENYKILFIGRLAHNIKRPHLVIEAFAKIANDFPDWIVEIWGAENGKLYYENLVSLIKKYNLENRVFLKGFTNDVEAVLQKGDIFVFPSSFEGFGMTLAEAMSMGLPVLGYRSCNASSFLIEDQVSGLLCDDGIDDLAEKMATLMGNRKLRAKMGENARLAMKPYDPRKIWDKWENIMLTTVNKFNRDV